MNIGYMSSDQPCQTSNPNSGLNGSVISENPATFVIKGEKKDKF